MANHQHADPEISVSLLLDTESLTARDILCRGECRHRSEEECVTATHLVFPYRGVYVRHVGRKDSVAEANQVLFFNESESYRISHPVGGGDACISMKLDASLLQELAPKEQLHEGGSLVFKEHRQRIDSGVQALAAQFRYGLQHQLIDPLEAESIAVALVRSALGERTSGVMLAGSAGPARRKSLSQVRHKLVDRAKLALSSDLARRWTLAEIASQVGASPVYLTQLFQQLEGMPLYRYQLRLRLARALDLLDRYDDLSSLGMDLGFSSHSHFTSAFRQTYGRTPAEFRRSIRPR